MLKLLLILWLATYCKTVFDNFLICRQTKKAVEKLADFCTAYKHSGIPKVREDYGSELTAVLCYYPAIKRLAGTPELSYSQTDRENYEAARSLAYKLQMQQNEAWHTFKRSLNPLLSAKELVLLPVVVLKNLGFQTGKIVSLICEVTFWIASSLYEMFKPEIKELILCFLENMP